MDQTTRDYLSAIRQYRVYKENRRCLSKLSRTNPEVDRRSLGPLCPADLCSTRTRPLRSVSFCLWSSRRSDFDRPDVGPHRLVVPGLALLSATSVADRHPAKPKAHTKVRSLGLLLLLLLLGFTHRHVKMRVNMSRWQHQIANFRVRPRLNNYFFKSPPRSLFQILPL